VFTVPDLAVLWHFKKKKRKKAKKREKTGS
jgi:hypothetical protein